MPNDEEVAELFQALSMEDQDKIISLASSLALSAQQAPFGHQSTDDKDS